MSEGLNISQAKRKSVHLPWFKKQYWSGFIFGLELGALAGLPLAFVIYRVTKCVVHLIEGV